MTTEAAKSSNADASSLMIPSELRDQAAKLNPHT